ncbi:MAG: PfkB family carbohydrate kinase [Pseudomonadota bacterium]
MNVAVVGHVEWCEFLRVEELPPPGGIVHAHERWEEPGGGGTVAAAQLARLAGSCAFYTGLGRDELGKRTRARLEALGIEVHTATTREPTRRAIVHVDAAGERTITVIGRKLVPRGGTAGLPWHELARADAVFFVSGDVEALRSARTARTLVATPRELETLRLAGVELDALVGSGDDDGERYRPGDLDPPPRLVVATAGPLGGWAQPGGPYRAVPPPGPLEDAYGCGDSFAAGLTFGLAEGRELDDALALAAACGAEALTRRGALGRDVAA